MLTRWSFGAALLGLFATACNPSPHIDPPASTTGTGGTAGSGGTTDTTTTTTASTGGGGMMTTTSSTGGTGGGPSGCMSNADCSFPTNLCDVASGTCVECLVNDDCSGKPKTVCSKAACVCPVETESFCPADGPGSARCVNLATNGADCGSCGHACFGTCAASKCVDAWEPVAKTDAPSPRTHHVAVWADTSMIVWGGSQGGTFLGDGAMYDPDKRTWTKMSNTNAPSARDWAAAVWTGSKMIVWGGRNGSGALGDGGAFDPKTNSWSNISTSGMPSPRYQHSAVWTGNPTNRMIIWGGFDGTTELSTGGYYTAADLWFELNAAGPPTQRRLHTAVWDDANGRMIVFGGLGLDEGMPPSTTALATGAIYGPLPGNEAWTPLMGAGPPPSPRYEHTSIWAGTYMIVWGGLNGAASPVDDGARFDAAGNNEWSVMVGQAPSKRRRHTAVYFKAMNRMVVWGGIDENNAPLGTGGVFDAAGQGMWVDTGVPKGPDATSEHTAVVAGSRMIVWGGLAAGGATNKGAVLDMTKVP